MNDPGVLKESSITEQWNDSTKLNHGILEGFFDIGMGACLDRLRGKDQDLATLETLSTMRDSLSCAVTTISRGIAIVGILMSRQAYPKDGPMTEEEISQAGFLVQELAYLLNELQSNQDTISLIIERPSVAGQGQQGGAQ